MLGLGLVLLLPRGGGVVILLGMLHGKQGVWYKLRPFGPGAHLYLFTWSYFSSLFICCLTQGNTALELSTAATYFSSA